MYAAAAIPPQTPSPAKTAAPAAGQQKLNLFDRLRNPLRSRRYNPQTERTHRHWVRGFVLFRHVRFRAKMAKQGRDQTGPFRREAGLPGRSQPTGCNSGHDDRPRPDDLGGVLCSLYIPAG